MSHVEIGLNRLLATYIDGIPFSLTANMLPLRSRAKFSRASPLVKPAKNPNELCLRLWVVKLHVFDVLLLLVNALEDFWLLALALAFRHRLMERGYRPLSKLFALRRGFFCGLTVHMRFMDGNCDREVQRPLRIKVKRGWMFCLSAVCLQFPIHHPSDKHFSL